MADEVIDELWRIKDDMAREHGYDLARLAADLRNSQGQGGHRVVDLHALRETRQGPVSASSGP